MHSRRYQRLIYPALRGVQYKHAHQKRHPKPRIVTDDNEEYSRDQHSALNKNSIYKETKLFPRCARDDAKDGLIRGSGNTKSCNKYNSVSHKASEDSSAYRSNASDQSTFVSIHLSEPLTFAAEASRKKAWASAEVPGWVK